MSSQLPSLSKVSYQHLSSLVQQAEAAGPKQPQTQELPQPRVGTPSSK